MTDLEKARQLRNDYGKINVAFLQRKMGITQAKALALLAHFDYVIEESEQLAEQVNNLESDR